jgi:hypothetical protein
MSKYKRIACEFKNGESLLKALQDAGLKFEQARNLRENTVAVHTHWKDYGSTEQPCALAIQKDDLSQGFLSRGAQWGSMDGMGFAWNGSGYDLIQDQHDQSRPEMGALLDQLKQRYSYHEISRQARAKGYTVRELPGQNGTINLVLVKR